MNPLFIPTLAGTTLCFGLGIWLTKKAQSKHQEYGLIIISTLAAVPAVLFAIYYFGVLGEAGWFYRFRAWPGAELFACGIGLLAGWLQTKRTQIPQIRKQVSAGFIPFIFLLCVGAPYLKQVFLRPDWTQFNDRWSEEVCLQSSESSCGPASAATLLKLTGKLVTEKAIAQESFTSRRGTENWHLIRTLRRHGLAVDYLIGPPNQAVLPFPAIVGVRLGGVSGTGHFIAILGRLGNRYVVGDPLNGREELNETQLRERYYFTGFSIVAKANSASRPVFAVALSTKTYWLIDAAGRPFQI